MADIAQLGLEIDHRQGQEAVRTLDTLAVSAKKAEAATNDLSRATKNAGQQEQQRAQQVAASVRRQEEILRQSQQRQRVIAGEEGRKQALAQMEALQRQFQADQAKVREHMARGFLTPAQAREAGRLNAVAYNDGLLRALNAGNAARAFQGEAGGAAYAKMAGSLKSLEQHAHGAAGGFRHLTHSAAMMASQALAVNGGLGMMVGMLGSMALGAGVMVAALAGLAALAFAWQQITKDAREAKEASEEALAFSAKLMEERRKGLTGDITRSEVEVRERMEQVAAQIRRMSTPAQTTEGMSVVVDVQKLRELQREYEELFLQLDNLERKRTRVVKEEAERQAEERKRAAEEAARIEEERLRKLEEGQRKAEQRAREERDAITALAQAGATLAQSGAYRLEGLLALVSAQEKLNGLLVSGKQNEVELARTTKELADVEKALFAERNRQNQASLAATLRGPAGTPRLGRNPGTVLAGNIPTADEERAALEASIQARQSAEVMGQIWDEAIRGIQQAFAKGFSDIFQNGLQGFRGMADAVVNVFRNVAAQIAAAITTRAIGLDKLLADVKSSGAGAITGTAGGGLLAFAGGMALAATAFMNMGEAAEAAAERAREAARLQRQAAEDWDRAIASFGGAGGSPLEGEFLSLLRTWRDNNKSSFGFGMDPDAIVELVRGLESRIAAGDPVAVPRGWKELLELVNAYTEALKRSAEATAAAAEEEIRKAEANREAAAAAAEAARRSREAALAEGRRQYALSFATRRAQMESPEAYARARYEEELDGYRQLLAAGTLTREMFDEIAGILSDELNVALQDLADAAKAAADAATEAARQQMIDSYELERQANIRNARAGGNDPLADVLEFWADWDAWFNRISTQGRQLGWSDAKINEELNKAIEAANEAYRRRFGVDPGTLPTYAPGGGAGEVADALRASGRDEVVRNITGITETSALRLIDVSFSQLSVLQQIENNTRGGSTRAGVGQSVQVSQNFYGPVTVADARAFGRLSTAEMSRILDERLANEQERDEQLGGTQA